MENYSALFHKNNFGVNGGTGEPHKFFHTPGKLLRGYNCLCDWLRATVTELIGLEAVAMETQLSDSDKMEADTFMIKENSNNSAQCTSLKLIKTL